MKIGKKIGKRAALLMCSLFLFGSVAEAAMPAFTKVNGKKVYGTWSQKKKVQIKR